MPSYSSLYGAVNLVDATYVNSSSGALETPPKQPLLDNKTLPYVIGGVAVLGIAAVIIIKRKKKGVKK